MKVIIALSADQRTVAHFCVSGFLDNEQDKGADDSHGVDVGERLSATLAAMPEEGGEVTLDAEAAGLLEFAAETWGEGIGDDDIEGVEDAADVAMSLRDALAGTTVTVGATAARIARLESALAEAVELIDLARGDCAATRRLGRVLRDEPADPVDEGTED